MPALLAEYRGAPTRDRRRWRLADAARGAGRARDRHSRGCSAPRPPSATTRAGDGAIARRHAATSALIAVAAARRPSCARSGRRAISFARCAWLAAARSSLRRTRTSGRCTERSRCCGRCRRTARCATLALRDAPKIALRMLDHWDNLDGSVERGYAGRSIWQWDSLPGSSRRAIATTRAPTRRSASMAPSLTNVNANARVLTPEYLAEGGRGGRRAAAVRHPRVPHGAVQRADRDRRAQDRRSARSRRAPVVEGEDRRDLRGASPTSAASS